MEKVYKLDLQGTINALGNGDSVTFRVAGEGFECSIPSVYNACNVAGGEYKYERLNNALDFKVTKL
jgi:hypothetical protein